MTTVQFRARQISDFEGFDIIVTQNGLAVDPKQNGILNARYDFTRSANGSITVSRWILTRFSKTYPGYSCQVLDAEGNIVNGNTLLSSVRATYEEQDVDV